jgi:hypothetical protein
MTSQTGLGANLIFVFSLPRTGSTLLQRIIATQPDVATASEPWILIPYLYTLRENGVYAEYGHRMMVRAVEDFCEDFLVTGSGNLRSPSTTKRAVIGAFFSTRLRAITLLQRKSWSSSPPLELFFCGDSRLPSPHL